ncbi:hypothetical protein ACIQ1D_19145 [Lysinibacillus xylanilyticus]|uniref:hypothetical protein n=1 Tax=Lysinibacillus xylanilyticus TaxID=582475 RepID=UPI0037FFCABA
MTQHKVSEIKEMDNEELITALVNNSVKIAHRNGRATNIQHTNELRFVKELSERFNLDEAKLIELLSK